MLPFFCPVLRLKIIFLDIPSYPPPIAVRNLLTNQFFKKKWRFCKFSNKKNKLCKTEEKRRVPGPFSSLRFCIIFCCCWKYTKLSIFLEKLIGQWIPDRNGRGIRRDIKKKYFHFQNATKNGNKVGTIYKVGKFQLFKLSKLCYHFLSSFENENIFF